MTGYTVHSGSNDKFAEGWDRIFGGDEATDPPTKSDKAKTPKAKAAKTGKKKGKRKSSKA